MERRTQNANHYHFLKSPETHLVPLVDLRTGDEINGFPNSVAQLSEIDGESPFFVLLNCKKTDFE